MSDDLVERVARELRAFYSDEPVAVCDGVAFKAARAAIAVCMEEAAKVAENASFHFTQTTPSTVEVVDVRHTIAAAIRALIKEPT